MDGNRPSSSAVQKPGKRIALWLFVGLVLAVSGILYHYFRISRPIGAGPVGPTVERDAFKTAWTARSVLLLGVGDSVTAGFGSSQGRSYFERLVANPPDEFADMAGINLKIVLPNLRWTNLSVSGSTSLEHWERQLPKLAAMPTNVLGLIVVTTGGNDIIHNYGRTPPREGAMYGATMDEAGPWIKNFRQRLDDMVHAVESKFPGGCHIFLANIYDPTDGAGDIENAGLPKWKDGMLILDTYNDIIAGCVKKHSSVHLIDMHDAFLGHGIHCTKFWRPHYRRSDPHYWYYDNLEDPNDRGYDAIRRMFLIEIAKALRK